MSKQSAARDRSGRALIAALFLTLPLLGQDAASVALGEADPVPALRSADALTRATAARVVLVRGTAGAVPVLREVLAGEKDAVAAREQVRALVILGTDDDVAFAASQLPRFPASIHGNFADAVGRVGGSRATTLYLEHVEGTHNPSLAVRLALWGRPAQVTATAARLLGAKDERAFRAVLDASAGSKVPIGTGVLTAALTSPSERIVTDTIWYLVKWYAADQATLPEELREAATAPREGAPVEEAFGRELLRRINGAQPVGQPDALAWLKSDDGRFRIGSMRDVSRLWTPEESKALENKSVMFLTQTETAPEFRLPIRLPPGLSASILKRTRCEGIWMGLAGATVDGAGRVQTLDAKNIGSTPGCQQALEAMLRLSLASPEEIRTPMENRNLLIVKPAGRTSCFDEDPVDDTISPRGPMRVGGSVKAPVVIRRVEPPIPQSVRRELESVNRVRVVVEAVIGRDGTVCDLRLVHPSKWPQLNSAALLAVSEWTFKPATVDGVPVDVIFNLTIDYKIR